MDLTILKKKKIIFLHILYSVRVKRHEAAAGRGDASPAGPDQEAGRNQVGICI